MQLLDRIEYLCKMAEVSPHQFISKAINQVSRAILNRSDISINDKENLLTALQDHFNHKPIHVDAQWSYHLASAMDEIINASNATSLLDLKDFYYKLYDILNSTWDFLDQNGHPSHTNKPVMC